MESLQRQRIAGEEEVYFRFFSITLGGMFSLFLEVWFLIFFITLHSSSLLPWERGGTFTLLRYYQLLGKASTTSPGNPD